MPKLVWDKAGSRRFETGVDRGVLYLPDGSGVPWNGLTAVEQDTDDITVEAYYIDGVKYVQTRTSGDYSGTLTAFTYPDEFEQFDGLYEGEKGMLFDNQPVNEMFGLSYRTSIGNDLQGVEYGYKIHLVYNLTATPDSRSHVTISDSIDASEMSWKISAVPEILPGIRPTAHIILDTVKMNPYLISDLEDLLYGTEGVADDKPVDNAVLDGGVAISSGDSEVNGGSPFSTSPELLDGGDVGEAGDQIIGGQPSTAGDGVLDGGTVLSLSSDELDGGTPTSLIDEQDTGTLTTTARLPALSELTDLITNWVLIDIVDNGDGTWSATGPSDFITMVNSTQFEIRASSARYLDKDTYVISTTSIL